MKRIYSIFTVGFCFILAACSGDVQEELGLKKQAPDEFAVVKRAPLEMPPNYALRPPRPGAPRPQEMQTDAAARQTVFGAEPAAQPSRPTSAEAALLQHAGGDRVDPDIRAKVDSETATMHNRNKAVTEKLLGIGGDKDEPSATVVNAQEEATRLRQNVEEGKPVTEGETPYIEE